MKIEYGEFLSVKNLATYLGISKSYIYQNWPKFLKGVRTYRIGRKILFRREDVDNMMDFKKRG